jgi:hypothetical protein
MGTTKWAACLTLMRTSGAQAVNQYSAARRRGAHRYQFDL